jgi:hypothetical protein
MSSHNHIILGNINTLILVILLRVNYWGKPEWAPHGWYGCARIVYVCMVRTSVTRNICPAWLYGYKREIFYCKRKNILLHILIIHTWATSRSNLANCKFTLVLSSLEGEHGQRYRGCCGGGSLLVTSDKVQLNRQESLQVANVNNNERQPRLLMRESETPRSDRLTLPPIEENIG